MNTLLSESSLFDSLRTSLQTLQNDVAILKQLEHDRPRVSVRFPHTTTPFLGQAVPLTIRVTNGSAQPLRNQPVLLTTSWGKLSSRDRLTRETGSSLTLRTDSTGQIQLSLQPATTEDLLAPQQAALTSLLGLLNTTAATPRQDQSALQEMAKIYRWNANHAYQQAVDIYFQNFGKGLLEAVNIRDYLASWEHIEATICASVQSAEDIEMSTEILGSGALRLQIKNWLGAFLEVLLAAAASDGDLAHQIKVATIRGQQEDSQSGIVDGVFQEVETYLTRQRGFVDDYIKRTVAKDALDTFLNTEIESLSLEDKLAIAPAVATASRAVLTGGIPAIAGLNQSRKDLKQIRISGLKAGGEINLGDLPEQVGQLSADIGSLRTGFGTLESSVGQLDSQLNDRFFQIETNIAASNIQSSTQLSQITTRLNTLGESVGQFEGQLRNQLNSANEQIVSVQSRIDDQFGRISTQVSQLNEQVSQIEAAPGVIQNRLDQVSNRLNSISEQTLSFDARLNSTAATLEEQTSTLSNRLNDTDEQLQTFDRRFDQSAAQNKTLSDRLDSTTERLTANSRQAETFSEQIKTFDERFSNTNRRIDAFDERFNSTNEKLNAFDERFSSTDKKLNTFDERFSNTDEKINAFDERFNSTDKRLDTFTTQIEATTTQLNSFDSRISTLNTQLGRTTSQVGSLQRSISSVSTQVGTLNTQIATVNNSIVRLDTQVKTVDSQIKTIETDVSGFDSRFTTMDNRVNGLNNNLVRVTRAASGRIVRLEDSVSRVGNNVLSLRTDVAGPTVVQPNIGQPTPPTNRLDNQRGRGRR